MDQPMKIKKKHALALNINSGFLFWMQLSGTIACLYKLRNEYLKTNVKFKLMSKNNKYQVLHTNIYISSIEYN